MTIEFARGDSAMMAAIVPNLCTFVAGRIYAHVETTVGERRHCIAYVYVHTHTYT